MSDTDSLARLLDDAQQGARCVEQIDPDQHLSLHAAYAIQAGVIRRRLERGETRTGVKMGFTSRAKMAQMGIDDLIWGRLTSGMHVEEGAAVSYSSFIRPRVEPELAFLLGRALPRQVTAAEALAAVEAVAPALEIIDSRYRDFRFGLTDVIADNASSSGYVVGAWNSPRQDLANRGLAMAINGRVLHVGSTAAILGHPLRSLVAAARLSADAGEPLQAGWIVMAGGATPAEWIAPGQYVSMDMDGLGHVGFHVAP